MTKLKEYYDRMKKPIRIEKKANGHAALQIFKKKYSGVTEYSPDVSKEERLHECQPLFEALDVFFCSETFEEPQDDPAVANYVKELLNFPKGTYDDCVDVVTGGIIYLKNKSTKGTGFASVGERTYG